MNAEGREKRYFQKIRILLIVNQNCIDTYLDLKK